MLSLAHAQSGVYVIDPADPDDASAYIPQLREPTRLVIGFDFGLGVIGATCGGCVKDLGGIGADVYVGALVTRRLALIAEVFSIAHVLPVDDPNERGLVVHSLALASARFWATPQFWLQSGIGGGWYFSSGDDDALAPAASFAIGGEIDHQVDGGIDLSVRIGLGRYGHPDGNPGKTFLYSVAGVVGWHWL